MPIASYTMLLQCVSMLVKLLPMNAIGCSTTSLGASFLGNCILSSLAEDLPLK